MGHATSTRDPITITDDGLKAQLYCDCKSLGICFAAKMWGISRVTAHAQVKRYAEDAEFRAKCDVMMAELRAKMSQRTLDLHSAASNALLLKLREPGHSLDSVLRTVVETARMLGLHKGDVVTAASAKSGASITLPAILTQPRVDPGNAPVVPPPPPVGLPDETDE
jgi:hypothetical protein